VVDIISGLAVGSRDKSHLLVFQKKKRLLCSLSSISFLKFFALLTLLLVLGVVLFRLCFDHFCIVFLVSFYSGSFDRVLFSGEFLFSPGNIFGDF